MSSFTHPGSLLTEDKQGCIISTFVSPKDPNWDFERFYNFLSDKGCVIYPGKLTKVDSFRIGTIGHLFPAQFEMLLGVIQEVRFLAVVICASARYNLQKKREKKKKAALRIAIPPRHLMMMMSPRNRSMILGDPGHIPGSLCCALMTLHFPRCCL